MRKYLRVFAAVLLGSLMLLRAPMVTGAAEVIPAGELRAEFAADKSAAEAKYLGKTVLVEGVVLSTGMSIYLTPNVILSDQKEGEIKVICVLPRLDAPKLSDFEPGETVIMSGRVYRLSERGVVLKDCKAAQS